MRLAFATVFVASVGCQEGQNDGGQAAPRAAVPESKPVAEPESKQAVPRVPESKSASPEMDKQPGPAPAPTVPTQRDVVGTWNVTLTADYSTCDDLAVGDLKQRQWLLGFEKSLFTLKVLGTQINEPADYIGALELNRVPPLIMFTSGTGAGIQLWLDGAPDELKGRRVVASKQNESECVKIFALKAKRVN